MRPHARNVGVACVVFFSVVGFASVYTAYLDVDGSIPRPMLAASIFGVFWGFWVLLSAWLILLYRRYRLDVSEVAVRQRGVLLDRTISLDTVQTVKWRKFPKGGSVRLEGIDEKLSIEFGNFVSDQRDELIEFLWSKLPEERQVGWSAFQKQFTDSPERRAKAKRIGFVFAVFFALHALVFFAFACLDFGNEYFMFAAINAAMVGYLVRKRRDSEESEAGLVQVPE